MSGPKRSAATDYHQPTIQVSTSVSSRSAHSYAHTGHVSRVWNARRRVRKWVCEPTRVGAMVLNKWRIADLQDPSTIPEEEEQPQGPVAQTFYSLSDKVGARRRSAVPVGQQQAQQQALLEAARNNHLATLAAANAAGNTATDESAAKRLKTENGAVDATSNKSDTDVAKVEGSAESSAAAAGAAAASDSAATAVPAETSPPPEAKADVDSSSDSSDSDSSISDSDSEPDVDATAGVDPAAGVGAGTQPEEDATKEESPPVQPPRADSPAVVEPEDSSLPAMPGQDAVRAVPADAQIDAADEAIDVTGAVSSEVPPEEAVPEPDNEQPAPPTDFEGDTTVIDSSEAAEAAAAAAAAETDPALQVESTETGAQGFTEEQTSLNEDTSMLVD